MPFFTYTARNAQGEALSGRVEAMSMDAAASQLLNSNITPLQILEDRAQTDVLKQATEWLRRRQPKLDDLIFFSRQLYTLMKAGVPIIRALNGLSENISNIVLKETLKEVVTSLESGRDLSGAFAKHPKIFSHLFVSMVQVGESTGQLDLAMLKLSEYLEREKDTIDRIKQAMRYPMIVVTAIVIAMVVINIFVIPKFAGIFARFGADLPWQTKLLMTTSNFMLHYWPYLLVLSVGGFFGLRYYIRNTPSGHLNWDRFKLRVPIVGKILYEALLARFATAFALTLRSGVPLIQGLHVTSHAVDNVYISDKIQQMRNGVERGDSLTRTAASSKLFTPLTIQMMQVGEETGAVDDMLDNVAHYYEREVDYKLKNLSSAIEPVLIVIIGAMVFVLALGVFLPLWNLSSVIH
ncbi:MAG: type II secretion system F family protein [Gammaproteobacteria bacterium]|nr:type II secretion system F family protein [Gammaproteobacteria bacterium]